MNTNLQKLLYMGSGLLLAALAFSSFFSGYTSHREYRLKAIEISERDRMISITQEDDTTGIYGWELIHLVLDAQRRAEVQSLVQDYNNVTNSDKNNYTIWVAGKNALAIDSSEIYPHSLYKVFYDKDSKGNVIGLHCFIN